MVAERDNVLMVPNAALRWTPQPDRIGPQVRQALKERKRNNPGGQEASAGKEDTGVPRQGVLWIPQGKYVKPMKVRLGLSDGSLTEVQNPKLQEGMQVVLGERSKEESATSAASPFTPQLFRRRGSGKKK
jgi:HlyD family secretion protein